MPRATVLLADDHAIVLEGLAGLLRDEFTVLGTVADGPSLIDAARRLRPDVIVTDLAMPGMSGLEALRRLKAEAIPVKVIFLTMHADAQLAAQALRAGASGFVVKHAAAKDLISAIHTVARGGRYIPPQIASDVLIALAEGEDRRARPLTARQRDVLALIAEGRTMKEVADALGLSPRTVESHKYQVMEALGLKTTADLVRYAIEHGLAGPTSQPKSIERRQTAPVSVILLSRSVIFRIVAMCPPAYSRRVNRPTVVLAEDHAPVAEQLRRLLAPEFDVIATVPDGRALVCAAEAACPDVVVTDIVMPGLDGIAATAAILARRPNTRVVLVTVHDDPELAELGYAAGALAYVSKHRASQELLPALRAAIRGERYVSPSVRDRGG